MHRCLIGVGLAGSLACLPPPVITPEDAGGAGPRLELASPLVDAGQASLRFGERVRRGGLVSIRSRDAVADLELDVSVSGPLCLGSEASCITATTLILQPGGWTDLPVAIELSGVGEARGVVAFAPRERGVAGVSGTVFGVGTAAPDCLLVEPSTIDFGTLNPGCPAVQRPLRITNDCVVPRLLSDGEIDPLLAPFALSKLTTLPRRLAPGESWSGLADFLGGTPGPHEALLRFDVDGELGVVVGLRGLRSETLPREYTLNVPSPQLDVLVVLDSSPSFVPRRSSAQQAVVRDLSNFGLFPGQLRVGVVGTGGTSLVPGGGERFFENSQVTFETSLREALANTPSDGDEVERCIETAAQVSAGIPFWRLNSRRNAICVTDAPEQSADPLAAIAVLADAGVRWNVVGPPLFDPDGGCQVEAFDDGGHVMTTFVLDGSVASICTNWRLPGWEAGPPPSRVFVLPFSPNFPITVWVDGVLLLESGWAWDGPSHTLEVLVAPRSTLVVRESRACAP